MNKLRISQEGLDLPIPTTEFAKLIGNEEDEIELKSNKKQKSQITEDKENADMNTKEIPLQDIKSTQEDHTRTEETSPQAISQENHHPQMIDEDVETFTQRLDTLILGFRTDSLKDFMKIKRNILSEQASKIEAEKNRCSSLLSAKQDELERLREDLVIATGQVKRMTTQIDRLALHSMKYNKHAMVYLFKIFSGWRALRTNKKNKNKVIAMKENLRMKTMKTLAFTCWKQDYMTFKKKKNKEQEEQKIKVIIDDGLLF